MSAVVTCICKLPNLLQSGWVHIHPDITVQFQHMALSTLLSLDVTATGMVGQEPYGQQIGEDIKVEFWFDGS